jgi:acetoin:2,6-dichlorophenolindophenol oxidoreductase subunit alpha
MMAEVAYENPLIPNARLKQIYLAMVRARMFGRALPARRRDGWTPGMDACLVSTSVDLGPGDLVSDALGGGVVEFLRSRKAAKRGGVVADCGAARTLPGVAGIAERLWAAMGAAAALKAAATAQGGVVVMYVLPGEVSAALWRKVLGFAAEQALPILFVVMPGERGARSGGACVLARGAGVPGIAVDGDDAVAIYRVAQESIGRARMGGGAALIECVPFVLSGVKGKRADDAVAGMERYLLQRGVVTQAWMEREARGFARRMAAAKAIAVK